MRQAGAVGVPLHTALVRRPADVSDRPVDRAPQSPPGSETPLAPVAQHPELRYGCPTEWNKCADDAGDAKAGGWTQPATMLLADRVSYSSVAMRLRGR